MKKELDREKARNAFACPQNPSSYVPRCGKPPSNVVATSAQEYLLLEQPSASIFSSNQEEFIRGRGFNMIKSFNSVIKKRKFALFRVFNESWVNRIVCPFVHVMYQTESPSLLLFKFVHLSGICLHRESFLARHKAFEHGFRSQYVFFLQFYVRDFYLVIA